MWKYLLFQFINKSLRFVPIRVVYLITLVILFFILIFASRTNRVVKENVRHILGEGADEKEVARVTREIMKNAFIIYVELLYVSRLSSEKLARFFQERVEIKGLEYLAAAKQMGGIVLVVGHLAGAEILAQIIGFLGEEVFVLSEPLRPKCLHDFIHRVRERTRTTFSPVSRATLRQARRRLEKGGIVAVAIDRDIQGRGLPTKFFGAEALMPLGAAYFALKTNSVFLPAFCRRVGLLKYQATVYPPIVPIKTGDQEADLRANTQLLTAALEDYIQEDPTQWVVLQRVWKAGGERDGEGRSHKSLA